MTDNELAQWMKNNSNWRRKLIVQPFPGINQQVLHGEAGSANMVYLHIAQAGLPKLFAECEPLLYL